MIALTRIIATSMIGLLFVSCNFDISIDQVEGKGAVTTQEHELNDFNQVIAENGWDVVLEPSKKPKLVVKANENLHPILDFSVKDNALTIASKDNKNIGDADSKTVHVHFTGELQKIAASSGAEIIPSTVLEQEEITVDASSGAEISLKLKTNRTRADASSGSEIKLTGTTGTFEADASSGSEINAKNLESKTAMADASSGAEINLTVTEDFTGDASSGGEVNYYGDPGKVSVENSVSGDVNRR